MKRLFTVLIIIALTCLGGFLWWKWAIQPVDIQDKTQTTFIIMQNETIRDIGYKLNKTGVIRNPIGFFIFVKLYGFENKIQAGRFNLSKSMDLSQIITALTHGSVDVWVTIPEGKRAQEISETLVSSGISSYVISWKQALEAKEGYLFPDTYRFPANIDLQTVVDTMQNNFSAKYLQALHQDGAGQASNQPVVKLSQSDAVILASLIEREGKSVDDMRLISSVLQNRLAMSMPLQVDAAIQYILGYQPLERSWWKKNISIDDLKINSPYNTYLNPGLPPGPICNPGLNALTAAFHPAKTDYLYYFTGANGVTHFAKTLAEHNTNIQKYQ